uniref:Serine/threonine-protein phosphatase n=1 Tax=Eutreptiella gymnastica TaxID=73025 RepID=A0A7S1IGF9_9EUGL|mmetsp:Transcript_15885/g.28140  ORF Transcript_15885/g.28140 Transcript_15885/m.28140 type:complete len:514 (+) Transcript_15885:45-1586(+)
MAPSLWHRLRQCVPGLGFANLDEQCDVATLKSCEGFVCQHCKEPVAPTPIHEASSLSDTSSSKPQSKKSRVSFVPVVVNDISSDKLGAELEGEGIHSSGQGISAFGSFICTAKYKISNNVLHFTSGEAHATMQQLDKLVDETDPWVRAVTMYSPSEDWRANTTYLDSNTSLEPDCNAAEAMVILLEDMWRRNGCFEWKDPEAFESSILELCQAAKSVLTLQDYPMLELQSPLYILGDIHGNFDDLYFYLQRLITFGDMRYTSNKLLFLGDYVDKGPASVEVAVYLLALKILSPKSIWLLRGNHETRQMRSKAGHGFWMQCKTLFGPNNKVYEALHSVFDCMPLAATVDNVLFCAHGGVPRIRSHQQEDRLQILKDHQAWTSARGTTVLQEIGETTRMQEIFTDLLWADPATEEEEEGLDEYGFGKSHRGPGLVTFGHSAISEFLAAYGLQYIVRAHEWMDYGLQLSKHGKVITIFSSSMYNNNKNSSAVVFVSPSENKLRFVSRHIEACLDTE